MSLRTIVAGLVPFLIAVAGCERPAPAPRWIPLAGEAGPIVAGTVHELSMPSGRSFTLVEDDGHTWLRTTLARRDWRRAVVEDGTLWRVSLSVRGTGRPLDGSAPQRLSANGREFEHNGARNAFISVPLEAGGFDARTDGVYLKLGPDEAPPQAMRLDVFAGRTAADGERARIAGRRFSGDGFALWPGERVELTLDLPPASALRFATCVEPAVIELASERPEESPQPLRFRITLDGTRIFGSDVLDPETARLRHHVVPLPAQGRRGARIVFEVDGPPAYASFLAPVIGPLAGDGGDPRPDLVVFLADTFRADNLAAYGRTDGLTPYLDALSAESLVFPRTWSVGTFTLPAHCSMFAGVWPRQVGASGSSRALPRAWTTLAEHLSAAGYRTGAVTESVLVSRDYGFDQGFEWWDEVREPLDGTLARARAFLDADDGRPVFLFVQTYRTHTPYAVRPSTVRRLAETVPIERGWRELQDAFLALPEPRKDDPRCAPIVAGIEALYRGAAADLDAGFERFHKDLQRRGLDDSGYLVFTSDHGEAFLEHDALYHTGKVWEELVRVPLFISGPDIAPGRDERAASLVDLAPTLCDLAGVEGRAEWLGRSLVDARGVGAVERPVFLFECAAGESTLGVVEWPRKVIDTESTIGTLERPFAAFDLARDPAEQDDLAAGDTAWPAQLRARFAPALLQATEPVVAPEDAALDAEKAAELRAMGYTGD